MHNSIFIYLIICSFFFSLSDAFQNYSTKKLGSFGSSFITKIFGAMFLIIIFIILYFVRKPAGPLFIPTQWNKVGIRYAIYDGIVYTLGLILLGISFYYNSKLDKPYNLGILTSIISFSFIFTIIIDMFINFIQKKPINFTFWHGLGISFIIIGVFILSRL